MRSAHLRRTLVAGRKRLRPMIVTPCSGVTRNLYWISGFRQL